MGERWKKLSDKEKQPYVQMAKRQLEEHKKVRWLLSDIFFIDISLYVSFIIRLVFFFEKNHYESNFNNLSFYDIIFISISLLF